jgi:hypothetical protein
MDEPIHPSESAFWDQVADWLLGTRGPAPPPSSPDGLEPLLRHEEGDPKPH